VNGIEDLDIAVAVRERAVHERWSAIALRRRPMANPAILGEEGSARRDCLGVSQQGVHLHVRLRRSLRQEQLLTQKCAKNT